MVTLHCFLAGRITLPLGYRIKTDHRGSSPVKTAASVATVQADRVRLPRTSAWDAVCANALPVRNLSFRKTLSRTDQSRNGTREASVQVTLRTAS